MHGDVRPFAVKDLRRSAPAFFRVVKALDIEYMETKDHGNFHYHL
jgi:hypothetical protein